MSTTRIMMKGSPGFLENVKQGISNFLTSYRDYFTDADATYTFAAGEPSIVIKRRRW